MHGQCGVRIAFCFGIGRAEFEEIDRRFWWCKSRRPPAVDGCEPIVAFGDVGNNELPVLIANPLLDQSLVLTACLAAAGAAGRDDVASREREAIDLEGIDDLAFVARFGFRVAENSTARVLANVTGKGT